MQIYKIREIVQNIKPDIIHCHCFWPTILAGIFLKKEIIVSTLHNNPLEDYFYEYGFLVSKIMTKISLKFQKSFYMNFAISNYIKKIYIDLGVKEDNLKVIYNGVKKIEQIERKKKSKTINLITVSVLNKIKNILFLLEVCKELNNRNIQFLFKIVGDGEDREKIEKKIQEYKLEEKILLIGKSSRENVYREMQNADIFLFASKSEGFGLVIIEAIYNGLKVLVPNIPVMSEIVREGIDGYILDFQVTDYVEKIIELNSSKINSFNSERIDKRFLVENMSEYYTEEYKKIIKKVFK